jgi:hypothetical protein
VLVSRSPHGLSTIWEIRKRLCLDLCEIANVLIDPFRANHRPPFNYWPVNSATRLRRGCCCLSPFCDSGNIMLSRVAA